MTLLRAIPVAVSILLPLVNSEVSSANEAPVFPSRFGIASVYNKYRNRSQNTNTVSYTHLDVYKRQLLTSGNNIETATGIA